MGILDLVCLTTDPDATTYYGFAYANPESDGLGTYAGNEYLNSILVKSNSNPASSKNVTWSVASMTSSRSLDKTFNQYYGDIFKYSCTVNAQGVFTMFGRYQGSIAYGDKDYQITGLRYDPAGTMDPSFNFKGPALGYANNGASSVLVHAIITEKTNTPKLATVNEATKTSQPQAPGPCQTITIGKIFNTSQASDCGGPTTNPYVYVNHGALTLICPQYMIQGSISQLFKITDPINAPGLGTPENFTQDITSAQIFVPIDGGPGQVDFALMKKFSRMWVFGKTSAGGRYADDFPKVDVTDPVGFNPNPKPPSSSSDSDKSSDTGVIVGVIAGVVAFAGVFIYLYRRNSTRGKNNTKPTVPKPSPAFIQGNNYAYAQQPGPDGGPNYCNPAGQYPATTYPLGQTAPTTILPMAPITPVPQHHAFQDQMQGFQFSSHPRPTFVTTAHGGEPEPVGPTGAAGVPWQPIPWQPTPFFPPAHSTNSIDASFPSATAFSNTTITQSSNDPQAIVPLSSPPSIPYYTRPSPEVNSPHALMNTKNPQYANTSQ
ncbi:hypothetical protein BGX29_012181 [Mortierella sp. GBA35]|nr:hypothetical protein BGX29_012181 [Mortierella sp. GBA35]